MNEDSLGARIKRLREERGMSGRELARLADLSSAFLSQVETDSKRSMNVERCYRIARVLDVSMDCLVKGLYSSPAIRRRRTICVTDADFARIELMLAKADADAES